jgi:GNAT superfamily N-acetyltransferase
MAEAPASTVRLLRGDVLHLDGVAQVWAEAGAMLVVALDDQDEVAAFAVARPLAPAGQEPPGRAAEVSYAGVRPGLQGAGLGRRVLQYLASEALSSQG